MHSYKNYFNSILISSEHILMLKTAFTFLLLLTASLKGMEVPKHPEQDNQSTSPTGEKIRIDISAEQEKNKHSSSHEEKFKEYAKQAETDESLPEDLKQKIFVEQATINNFTRPLLVMPHKRHNPGSKLPEGAEEEAAREEGRLTAIQHLAEENTLLDVQNKPEQQSRKLAFLKNQNEIKIQAQLHAEDLLKKEKHQRAEQDLEEGKKDASQQVALMMHKRKELKKQLPYEERLADAKEDAHIKVATQLDVEKSLREHRLKNIEQELEQDKQFAAYEVKVAAHKRTELKKQIPLEQRIAEEEEDARIKAAGQKKLQNELKESQDSLNARARELGLAQAAGELAAKVWLQANDASQSWRGKFTFLLKEVTVRLAVETLVVGIKSGTVVLADQIYEWYLKKYNPEQMEMRTMQQVFKHAQLEQEKEKKNKIDIQTALLNDSKLTDELWKKLLNLKLLINETQNTEQKKELEFLYKELSTKYLMTVAKLSAYHELNIDNQPQLHEYAQKRMQIEKAIAARKAKKAEMPQASSQKQQQTPMQATA